MNRFQFRGLLITYAVGWLVLGAYSGHYGLLLAEEALMSDEIHQPQAANAWEDVLGLLGAGLVGFGGTMLAVITWIGLFFFWKPARILYAVYLGLVYLLLPLVGGILYSSTEADASTSLSQVQTPWIDALGSIISLLDGAILVIIFSAVGSHLFGVVRDKITD
jgi:hypothetical protein